MENTIITDSRNVGQVISAIGGLPFGHLVILCIVICTVIFTIIALLTIKGIRIRKKDGSMIRIGGMDKKLEDIEHDRMVQQELKQIIDHYDSECVNDLFDNMDIILHEIQDMIDPDRCIFIAEKLIRSFRDELGKRIRRNDLKHRLDNRNYPMYVKRLQNEVEKVYTNIYYQSTHTNCNDHLKPFMDFKETIDSLAERFCNMAKKTEINMIKNKIATYEKYMLLFKDEHFRKTAAEAPLDKNRIYLKNLE